MTTTVTEHCVCFGKCRMYTKKAPHAHTAFQPQNVYHSSSFENPYKQQINDTCRGVGDSRLYFASCLCRNICLPPNNNEETKNPSMLSEYEYRELLHDGSLGWSSNYIYIYTYI